MKIETGTCRIEEVMTFLFMVEHHIFQINGTCRQRTSSQTANDNQ